MKLVASPSVLAWYLLCGSGLFASGQYFEDASKTFEYLQLDLVHRGSFNNTECVRDLLNCWEIIKPDYICNNFIVYESICGLLRRDCTYKAGTYEEISHVPMYESFCKDTPWT